jgi:hypothetical protein
MKLDMGPTILENLYNAGKVGGYNTVKIEGDVFYHILVTTYLRLHATRLQTKCYQITPM